MELPTISNYGQGRSDNSNTIRVDVGDLAVWFSYKTPVAFLMRGNRSGGIVLRENVWGPTTGKHLNWIDDGRKLPRLSGEDFELALERATK